MSRLLITNIGQLATPEGSKARAGEEQGRIRQLKNAWLLVEEGRIAAIGQAQPPAELPEGSEILDAGGRLVTPGLVDAHTHLVFGGWRAHEMAQKLAGVPYLDILAAGGGILDTLRRTREASQQQLEEKALKALQEMLSLGTTTCEAKSGYGLNLEDELKQLRAAASLHKAQPVELVSTLMAAHALPPEYREDRQAYLKLIMEEIIPAVAREGLADYCDVFCEQGVFDAEESRLVLLAGQKAGLRSKIHADEIHPIGGSELAGEIRAISAEHLIAITEGGIEALRQGDVIACLLPATSLYLGKGYAPARKMVQAGVPVALGSDFNPGSCPSLNLQLCMTLSCLYYRLSPAEVLTAATLNAAAAIGRAETIGSLETGKQADLVLWDAPDLDYLCYRLGSNLVSAVVKKGEVVHRARA